MPVGGPLTHLRIVYISVRSTDDDHYRNQGQASAHTGAAKKKFFVASANRKSFSALISVMVVVHYKARQVRAGLPAGACVKSDGRRFQYSMATSSSSALSGDKAQAGISLGCVERRLSGEELSWAAPQEPLHGERLVEASANRQGRPAQPTTVSAEPQPPLRNGEATSQDGYRRADVRTGSSTT